MAEPTVKDMCENAKPESEIEHLVVCPVCGQIFDCREERSVAHHAQPAHAPLLDRPAPR